MSGLTRWIRRLTPARRDPWAQSVAAVIDDLTELNGETEVDFLEVGQRLTNFVAAAREIHTVVDQIAASLEGEASEQADASLREVLSRSVKMQGEVGSVAARISALQDGAETIRRAFESVGVVALSFHVAASLGRIETARLGASAIDLSHLGEEVGSCADSIRDRAHRAAEISVGLKATIDEAVSRISVLSSAELAALPALTRTAEEHLDQLREHRRQARVGSASLAYRFESLSAAVGAIVTALQFHDITRQQLEHIIGALQGVNRGTSVPSDADLAVIDLQCRQLAAAAATFDASVERVRVELDRISKVASEVISDARSLAGLSKDGREGFLGRLERCFAAILASVSQCGEMDSAIAGMAGDLRRTVAALAEGASEVREVGRGIHYLSLNTMIQAVHLGAIGEPLGVVAAAMHALQADTIAPTGEAARALDGMTRAIAALSEKTDSCETFIDNLSTQVVEVHGSEERVRSSIEHVASATARLCADVENATATLRVGARFADVGRRCGKTLQGIVEEYAASCLPSAQMEELATRYTMQSERDVHGAVTEGPQVLADGLREGDIELF